MGTTRFAVGASLLSFALAASPAHAATKHSQQGNQEPGAVTGIAVGAMLPQGSFGELNDPGYYVQARSLYVGKIFGGRAATYYGDTAGAQGFAGGRVYGVDFDALLKFGSARTFGYVFAGAGYGKLTYTAVDPAAASGAVRRSSYDWCWTGGVGFSFRKKSGFYLEASYVSYQTNPTADFVPVVIGFEF